MQSIIKEVFKKGKKSNGFTLVEILVVMVIVAVLSTLSMVAFAGARKTSRDQKRKADLEQMRSALEMYRSDCLTYPAALASPLTGCPPSGTTTYMSTVPSDAGSYGYRYIYLTPNSYCLCAMLEMGGSTVTAACVTAGCSGTACGGQPCNYSVVNP